MNNDNLIPFDKLPPEKHKELSRKGGIASGKARRRKAYLKKQVAELLRNMDYLCDLTEQEYKDFKRWQRQQKKKK